MRSARVQYNFIEVSLDETGGIATLVLNRPPLNIMNIEMMEEVTAALLRLGADTKLKVLVIRGRGEAFSCGVDIADHTPDKVTRLLQVFHRIFESIRLLDVVAVAAVDGVAFGGGFELALGCNLIVASASARFRLPEMTVGVFPAFASIMLPRVGPRRKAMEWILMGEEIDVADLERFGLVNRVLPADEFERGLSEFVAKIASMSAPVLKLAKRAQTESYYSAYEEALYKAENMYLHELMPLDDPREGLAAFLAKREPKWTDS
jgi:cyclohexa-1,5-dienecarbonyl-CoA hydratase